MPAASTHSTFSASSAYRWLACPGSVSLCADIPEPPTSKYAAEGTHAHAVAAKCLEEAMPDASHLLGCIVAGEVVHTEMIESVNVYLEHVVTGLAPEDELHVEKRLELSRFGPDVGGTADAIIVRGGKRAGELDVYDYKHGAGVVVKADGNPQPLFYALGAVDVMGGWKRFKTIRVHIVQPRCAFGEAIQTVTLASLDLFEFGMDLGAGIDAARKPGAAIEPGDHCRFCKAKVICTAREQKALAVAGDGFGAVTVEPQSLTPADLGKRLAAIPLLKAWIKTIEDHARVEAFAGRMPAGFKLVASRATRQWTDSDWKVASKLAHQLGGGADDYFERSLLSPAAVEKKAGKKAAAPVLATLCKAVSNSLTLAPADDKRPAVNPAEISTAGFGPMPVDEDLEA